MKSTFANRTSPHHLIWDIIIVFFNISYTYSIFPFITLRYLGTIYLIIIINVLYALFRFGNARISLKDSLFILAILISVVNIISSIVTNGDLKYMILGLLTNLSFYLVLAKIYAGYNRVLNREKSISYILYGYIIFCVLNIISSILLFILIKIGFNPFVNQCDESISLFATNIKELHVKYFFPYDISVFSNSPDIRIPFFQEKGLITGFSHEPHTLTFLITPSLFFFLYRFKTLLPKIIILIVYLLTILIAASTTNILSLLICITVYSVIKVKKYPYIIFAIIILAITAIVTVDFEYYEFIIRRMSGSSSQYSETSIGYAFKPLSVWGGNMYDKTYVESVGINNDVGFFKFVINLCFLAVFGYRIVKLLISKDSFKVMIGFMLLYFFCHSAKLAMTTYSLSYFYFFIFIIAKCSESRVRPVLIRNNITRRGHVG